MPNTIDLSHSIGTELASKIILTGGKFSIYPGVTQYSKKHWLKRAMKWAYDADYIHAWVGFSLGGIPLVYHSTGFGVHVAGWESLQKNRTIKHMWEIPLEEEAFLRFAKECFQETGKKYGNRQLLGMAVVKGLSKIGIKLKKLPFGANRGSEHVCSETAQRMIVKYTIASDMLDWTQEDPDLWTPVDVVNTCQWIEEQNAATALV